MPHRPLDAEREQRIRMEIVADAHDAEEQARGRYAYLEDTLRFPVPARCSAACATSPLAVGDAAEIVGLASGEQCAHGMLVLIPRQRRTLAVPLAQLEALGVDDQTRQAIEDWRYWVDRGYGF